MTSISLSVGPTSNKLWVDSHKVFFYCELEFGVGPYVACLPRLRLCCVLLRGVVSVLFI